MASCRPKRLSRPEGGSFHLHPIETRSYNRLLHGCWARNRSAVSIGCFFFEKAIPMLRRLTRTFGAARNAPEGPGMKKRSQVYQILYHCSDCTPGGRDRLVIHACWTRQSRQRDGQWHEGRRFAFPYIGDRSRLASMGNFQPQFLAALLQPIVQGVKGWKARRWLPKPMAGVPNIFFDLPLLPARRRIAKFHVKQVVAGHG
jgi:hypothetical protein